MNIWQSLNKIHFPLGSKYINTTNEFNTHMSGTNCAYTTADGHFGTRISQCKIVSVPVVVHHLHSKKKNVKKLKTN